MRLVENILDYLVSEDSVLLQEDIIVHDFTAWHEISEYDYMRIKHHDTSGKIHVMCKIDQHGKHRYYVQHA
jgi:hypothetical protein